MEEFTILQSMLNILNSNNSKKKAIIETLLILLDTYDIHGEFDVYNLIVANTQNLCFQVFDSQSEYSTWKDSDVSLDNLKSLLTYFIDIIKKRNNTDITRLFQHCVQLSNKVDFKNCSSERINNIEFCVQKLYISCSDQKDDCKYLNQLRNTLINVLNEPYLNKTKFDVVLMFLNNIVSVHCIPTLWHNIKPMIKLHPDRVVSLLFNMQCLFFDPLCVGVVLNDDTFWNLTCDSLTCESNIIRTYNNVILKLLCSQLKNENVNCWANENKERCVKVWNDYVVVMETLENTQQHLILPILSTAKKLAPNELDDACNDYQLPLKWIMAMYCKMSKHNCKYVVLASIDIITSMPMISLKTDKKLLRSFVDSLNNVFLYKMPDELSMKQPQLEIILSLWFNKLMITNDGHDVFAAFLSFIPTVKWSIVALIFLSKSLANISSVSPFEFNIINHVLNIKSTVEKMPNSYLKTVVLSFLFIFTSKFVACVDNTFSCDLFDCITIYGKNTKSWEYTINSIRKINDLNCLDEQLSQRLSKKHNVYSTSVGLLVLSDIIVGYSVCAKKLDEIYTTTVDVSDLLDFLECLLEVESRHGGYDNCISRILDKHIWSLTTHWIDACLQQTLDSSCDDPVICKFLDKVLCSKRIINTTKVMNTWLVKCNSILMNHTGNYSVLAIYSWIGKYATRYSTESTLKNDWLSFTKYFIGCGFFSLKNQGFYRSRKPGMHKIPQLDIINTFFQYSTVPEEQMLDVLDWLIGKTVERYDNCWSVYFSTAKTIFCGFPIKVHLKKIIQFIENCWEFLVNCRVSCFPNATESFIKMAFLNKMLSEEKYAQFIKNEIVHNLLTEKYRDKFSVCFSLLLLEFFKRDQSNIINMFELYPMLSEFFAKCILFSIDRYSAMKIEWDTIEYVRTLNNFPLTSDILIKCLPDDKYLRFNTIKYLYKLNSNTLWKNVLKIIVKTESLLRDRKFFHNSKAYRIKQRAVQVLLMIACDKQQKLLIFDENIYKWSLSSLKEVCHIHSVAYQLIWLLVLIYNKSLSFSDFWNDFNNAQENHNYLCSFISIIYHLHGMKSNNQFEVEAKTHLLPLCFSNGYKIRLYAQVVICKLFSNKSKQFEQPLLCTTIQMVIAKNEEIKKYENPFDDFFYQELDVINSLSLKNVCVEVPRLLNIVYEERFPLRWLNDFSVTIINNNKYDLSLCSVSSYIEKNTALVSSNEITTLDNAQNAQRKYVPSQPLDECTTNSALIVVASLIDRTTNLGGLARTCQVFGASTLVVDSLSCVEKREFTALSMSAEKHQHIIEVRAKNLKSYLKKKKNEGYQIVAAEQTVDSVKLHNIKFPLKCVLLLGNETSGIPHELLTAMDTCIEIEQLGIVRSLNVHVAGSLFIWEYTKQHCLKVSS